MRFLVLSSVSRRGPDTKRKGTMEVGILSICAEMLHRPRRSRSEDLSRLTPLNLQFTTGLTRADGA